MPSFKGNYVSINMIKEKALRMFDFDNVLNNYEIAELLWEFIGRIGDPSILITKITDGVNGPKPIEIINYRGQLPDDMFEIINGTVRDYESKSKLIPSNNPFFLADITASVQVDDNLSEIGTSYNQDNTGEVTSQAFDSALIVSGNALPIVNSYIIQNSEIITTMETGYVEMSYKTFPLDDNGFPMIPDHPKLINAITWAILERTSMKLLAKNKITEKLYDRIEQKYLFAKSSAINALKLRTIPEMEAFKNRFVRLVPDFNQYGNNFTDYGQPEDFIKHSF